MGRQRDVTAHETERAQADIRRAVSDYFERIESLHGTVHSIVTLLLEDPHNRAQLELLEEGDESTQENFRLLFREVLQTELSRAVSAKPAFHVVLDFEGGRC